MSEQMNISLEISGNKVSFTGTVDQFQMCIEPIVDYMKSSVANELQENEKGEQTDLKHLGVTTKNLKMTTKAVATKLAVNSGPSLAYAAVAKLSLVDKMDAIQRKQILQEMKEAFGYFKPSYAGNLSVILNSLEKDGVLIEVAKEIYTVSAESLSKMEGEVIG